MMASGRDQGNDAALQDLFAGARRAAPIPSEDFLARLEMDMAGSLPEKAAPASEAHRTPSLFKQFRGFFAASGLTGAAALGIWIGFVMPDTLNTWATGYDATDAGGIGAFLPYADLAALEE